MSGFTFSEAVVACNLVESEIERQHEELRTGGPGTDLSLIHSRLVVLHGAASKLCSDVDRLRPSIPAVPS